MANGDKENFHDEIAQMAMEREFEDAQADEMYEEMQKAKPYLGEGVIWGPRPLFTVPARILDKPCLQTFRAEDSDIPF